ncbi:MAG: hypothetical protein RLZ98_1196 [Pseudomonadota bacterium]|jgi:hypothetical protein
MEAVHERDGETETIEFTRQATPVRIAFAALPALVVVQMLLVIVFNTIPATLLALMLVSAGCCAALAVLFVDQVLPVRVKLSPEGLRVERTWGSADYPWQMVEAVKMTGATGTFGDDPTEASTQRFGIGLFLRVSGGSGERDVDDNPDVILYSGNEGDAAQLIRMADHINAYRGRLGGQRTTTVKKFGGAPRNARPRQIRA